MVTEATFAIHIDEGAGCGFSNEARRRGFFMRTDIVLLGVLLGASSFVARAAQAQSYFIDETTDWTGNGCEAEDLEEVTAELGSMLDAGGWTGRRYTNSAAWPQDIMESCSSNYGNGGLDATYGDSADLVVLAGHGNTGFLAYGYKRDGKCTVDLGRSTNLKARGEARLGEMGGARASLGMWLTCCTLKKESLAAHGNFQWLKQQLGFHGESDFNWHQPVEFLQNNAFESNTQSWLDAMEDRPGWFTGSNSAIVVSYGKTSAEANDYHNNLALTRNVVFPRAGGPACSNGPPAFKYVYTLLDHGSDGCD
jgi:hypothetical protein